MFYTISENTFIDTYKPENAPDGFLYRHRDPRIPADLREIELAEREFRLWSYLDVDGLTVITNGRRYVNRLFHVICEVPYKPGEIIEVYPGE